MLQIGRFAKNGPQRAYQTMELMHKISYKYYLNIYFLLQR